MRRCVPICELPYKVLYHTHWVQCSAISHVLCVCVNGFFPLKWERYWVGEDRMKSAYGEYVRPRVAASAWRELNWITCAALMLLVWCTIVWLCWCARSWWYHIEWNRFVEFKNVHYGTSDWMTLCRMRWYWKVIQFCMITHSHSPITKAISAKSRKTRSCITR